MLFDNVLDAIATQFEWYLDGFESAENSKWEVFIRILAYSEAFIALDIFDYDTYDEIAEVFELWKDGKINDMDVRNALYTNVELIGE